VSRFTRKYKHEHSDSGFRISSAGDKIRIERFSEKMQFSDAFSFVSDFYSEMTKSRAASTGKGVFYSIFTLLIRSSTRQTNGRRRWLPEVGRNSLGTCNQAFAAIQHRRLTCGNPILSKVHDTGAYAAQW
jgi:hypothetical protein